MNQLKIGALSLEPAFRGPRHAGSNGMWRPRYERALVLTLARPRPIAQAQQDARSRGGGAAAMGP